MIPEMLLVILFAAVVKVVGVHVMQPVRPKWTSERLYSELEIFKEPF